MSDPEAEAEGESTLDLPGQGVLGDEVASAAADRPDAPMAQADDDADSDALPTTGSPTLALALMGIAFVSAGRLLLEFVPREVSTVS